MNPSTPALPPTTATGAATAAPRADATRGDAGAFAALLDLSLAATPQPHDDGAGDPRADRRARDATEAPDDAVGARSEPPPDPRLAAPLVAPTTTPAAALPSAGVATAPPADALATERAGRTATLAAGGGHDAAAAIGGDAGPVPATAATAAAAARRAGAATKVADDTLGAFDAVPVDRAARGDTAALAATVSPPGDTVATAMPPGAGTPMLPAVAATDAVALAAAATAPAAETGPGAGAPVPEARLPQPPHSPAFAAALGQQVGLWIRHGVQQAVLQLNPADLGPVAVHIALDGQRAHVDFSAAQASTRDALEASLPALASALRDSGLMLAGGGVFDRPREHGRDADTAPPAGHRAVERAADTLPAVAPRRRGVVDLVA